MSTKNAASTMELRMFVTSIINGLFAGEARVLEEEDGVKTLQVHFGIDQFQARDVLTGHAHLKNGELQKAKHAIHGKLGSESGQEFLQRLPASNGQALLYLDIFQAQGTWENESIEAIRNTIANGGLLTKTQPPRKVSRSPSVPKVTSKRQQKSNGNGHPRARNPEKLQAKQKTAAPALHSRNGISHQHNGTSEKHLEAIPATNQVPEKPKDVLPVQTALGLEPGVQQRLEVWFSTKCSGMLFERHSAAFLLARTAKLPVEAVEKELLLGIPALSPEGRSIVCSLLNGSTDWLQPSAKHVGTQQTSEKFSDRHSG